MLPTAGTGLRAFLTEDVVTVGAVDVDAALAIGKTGTTTAAGGLGKNPRHGGEGESEGGERQHDDGVMGTKAQRSDNSRSLEEVVKSCS